jgi:hypothetical protein
MRRGKRPNRNHKQREALARFAIGFSLVCILTLHDAAARLRSHAEELNNSSAQLQSAVDNLNSGWFSDTCEAAHLKGIIYGCMAH